MDRIRRILAALLMAAILLTSIPFAFAEDGAAEIAEVIAEPTEEAQASADEEEAPAAEEVTEAIEEIEAAEGASPEVEPGSEPSFEGSTIDEPVIEEPVIEEPVEDEPIVDEPIVDELPAETEAPSEDEETSLPEETEAPTPEAAPLPTFVPADAPSPNALSAGEIGGNAQFYPVCTVEGLARFMDMSVSALAELLEMSADELYALSPEEIAQLHESLAQPISTYSSAGSISLGRTFSGKAYSSSSLDYSIYISRSGRYLLTMNASKYMVTQVYYGSEKVGYVGHFCNGSTGYWTVDLEAGKTYDFKVAVDKEFSSGYCDFSAVLKLYIDGNYAVRAKSLAYDRYEDFSVQYSNDYQIYCFTAVEGKKYRVTSTGSMQRTIEVCDSSFSVVSTSKKYVSGTHTFDVTLTPGKTYYIKVHGQSYRSSTSSWYKTGAGQIKIECLDKLTNPITFTASKKSVDPGFGDSIRFTVSTKYATKVRLVVDGSVYGGEYTVSKNKATINASFHVSGSHNVQIQGYYNDSWSLLSSAISIKVNKKTALGTPSFSSVINNSGTAATGSSYIVHWYKLDGAEQYGVYVYSGDVLIYTTTVSGLSASIPGSILGTSGIYTVDVYGMGKNVQQSSKPGSAQITVEYQSISMALSSVINDAVITWTLKTGGASYSAQYRFDVYDVSRGLVHSGSYTSSKTFSYTCPRYGEYYVIAYVRDGGTVVSTVSEATVYKSPCDHPKTEKRQLGVVYERLDGSTHLRKTSYRLFCLSCGAGVNDVFVESKEETHSFTGESCVCGCDAMQLALSGNSIITLKKTATLTVKDASGAKLANKSLTWTTSDKSIAAVSSKGVVTAKAVGYATITAKAKNGSYGVFEVQVLPAAKQVTLRYDGEELKNGATITLSRGDTVQLVSIVAPEGADPSVTWKSSNAKTVSVDEYGFVSALKKSSKAITITAKSANGKTATVKVKVVDPYEPTAVMIAESGTQTLPINETLQLHGSVKPNAADQSLTWTSSNKKYATVSASGLVTPLKAGKTVTITAKSTNGKTASVTVKIVAAAEISGEFKCSVSGGECTITGYRGNETHLVVPAAIQGYPVTAIGDWAFDGCETLRSITLPASVVRIGRGAFYRCRYLESITLPDGVTEIKDWTFAHCDSLTSIVIPGGATSIGEVAFANCDRLTRVTIPASVTRIDMDAFMDCPASMTICGRYGSYAQTFARMKGFAFTAV